MTPKPSTHLPVHIYYGMVADSLDRDPVQSPEANGRATVPMGRGFGLWQRMNPGAALVYVHDAEGNPRGLTPKQYAVYQLADEMIEGPMLTMRDMAQRLGFAPSTVSRALGRLQAWGILVYLVGRGRFAGLVIIRYVRDGGFLDAKRKAAKERVRRWYEASQRRLSRLAVNVAPYLLERRRGTTRDSLYDYLSITTKGATLTTQRPWTVQELREAGIR